MHPETGSETKHLSEKCKLLTGSFPIFLLEKRFVNLP